MERASIKQRANSKEPLQRKALGRGLAALLPQVSTATSATIRELSIEKVQPNRRQPRKIFDEEKLEELAQSISARGVLQPIVVRQHGDAYEIVAGERRWRAAARAGLKKIPAVVKELNDSDVIQVALIENIQRQDLDPLEEAEAYSRLVREYRVQQENLAAAVGKSRSAIANSLRLLKLPSSIIKLLADGKLTAGHARALMTLKSEEHIPKLAKMIIDRKWSVREAEHQARLFNVSPKTHAKNPQTPAELQVQDRLQKSLGTRVRLHHRKGKGRIEIFFHSLQQLNDLLGQIEK